MLLCICILQHRTADGSYAHLQSGSSTVTQRSSGVYVNTACSVWLLLTTWYSESWRRVGKEKSLFDDFEMQDEGENQDRVGNQERNRQDGISEHGKSCVRKQAKI